MHKVGAAVDHAVGEIDGAAVTVGVAVVRECGLYTVGLPVVVG